MAHMAAFKAHCAFGVGMGLQLRESVALPERSREAMGQFGRITTNADLPSVRELSALVKRVAAAIDAGVESKRSRTARAARPAPEAPPDLVAALARNAAARKTFEAFAPSHRRDYVEWITGARRDETRRRRLAQALAWLAEGKRQNWKYEA